MEDETEIKLKNKASDNSVSKETYIEVDKISHNNIW